MTKTKLRLIITLTSIPLTLSRARTVSASDIAIGIQPQVTEIVVLPGAHETYPVTVKNSGNKTILVRPLFQPFEASPKENGEVQYLDTAPRIFSYISVTSEGLPVEMIELKPGEEKQLKIDVRIPENERSGDYYMSLIMMSEPEVNEAILDKNASQQETSITAYSTISGGVASHILISVDPKLQQNVTLKEFSTPIFSQKGPLVFHAIVTNENSNFSRVHGQIEIRNIFGRMIKKVTIPETRILAGNTRSLDVDTYDIKNDSVKNISNVSKQINIKNRPEIRIDEAFFPGFYEAKLTLISSSKSQPIEKSTHFFIAPVELLLTFLAIILIGYIVKKRIQKKAS